MADTSLGEGIGLQQGANRDDFWAKQIYQRGAEKKREREKADEELIKASDFKVDYSKKLPVYAKQMANVQRDILIKVALARQNNKNTARSVVADDLYRAQLQLGKLEQDNARAMAYIADDKTAKDAEVISTLTSPDATFEDIASIHDGQFFMTDATGTFAYKPVPLGYDAPKFDKYSMVGKPTGKSKIVGDTRYNELQDGYSQENIDAEINQLAQDPKFQQTVLFEKRKVPAPEGVDPIEFKRELVKQKAAEEVNRSLPKGAIRYDPTSIYHPPASDKKDEPVSLKPLAQFDIASKVMDIDTNKPTDVKVPIQINLPVKVNPTVIPTGFDVLDVETNKQVSDKPTNLSFTPSTLQYKNITRTKNGKKSQSREWYVIGTAVDIARASETPPTIDISTHEGETSQERLARITKEKAAKDAYDKEKIGSKKTTFNVMVPLSSVKGALQGVDLSELDAMAQEYDGKTGGDGASTPKASTSTLDFFKK